MKCSRCLSKVNEKANYCWQCGIHLKTDKQSSSQSALTVTSGNQISSDTNSRRSPLGLLRTLSTERITRENRIDTLAKLNSLFEKRSYQQGDKILRKGDENRDLYFLTEGLVEISSQDKDGNIVLNTLPAPNIFGDIGFYFGFPRTATVEAKSTAKVYVLKYDILKQELSEFPNWLSPLLTSFVSGIKTLNDDIKGLRRKVKNI